MQVEGRRGLGPSWEMNQLDAPVGDGWKRRGVPIKEGVAWALAGEKHARDAQRRTWGGKRVQWQTRWSVSAAGVGVGAEGRWGSNPPAEATGVRWAAAMRVLKRIWVQQAGGARRRATKPCREETLSIQETVVFECITRPREGGRRGTGEIINCRHYHSDDGPSKERTRDVG